MLVAVDIGNTATKIYDGNNILIIPTVKDTSSDFLIRQISQKINVDIIDSVSLCSVVPQLTEIWIKSFKNIYVLDYKNKLFKNDYPKPQEVGGDIIAATIAANSLFGYPNVVVDLGTATNINIVNNKGEFIGCSIMPGIRSSLNSLVGDTSLLDEIKIDFPASVIGQSTENAIQSGLLLGETYRIDGLINKIKDELGYSLETIITGGWSELISKNLMHSSIIEKGLVLKGLLIAYENR